MVPDMGRARRMRSGVSGPTTCRRAAAAAPAPGPRVCRMSLAVLSTPAFMPGGGSPVQFRSSNRVTQGGLRVTLSMDCVLRPPPGPAVNQEGQARLLPLCCFLTGETRVEGFGTAPRSYSLPVGTGCGTCVSPFQSCVPFGELPFRCEAPLSTQTHRKVGGLRVRHLCKMLGPLTCQ